MNVFLTGATGFVGGNLLRDLIDRGARVKVLARKGSDRQNLDGLKYELVEGGLDDAAFLTQAMADCEWCFHVAAHYSLLRRDRTAIYKSNVDGTENLLRAARAAGVKRIVHTSSVAAIGVPPDGQIADENTRTTVDALVSDYKKSKFLAEELARKAAREGLPVIIASPSTPIGPRDVKPTPTGDIIVRFLKRKMPVYVHTGLNLVDVRDVCAGHILAAEKGRVGERYILGNKNLTFKELLDTLGEITGLPSPTRAIPHWIPITVGAMDEFVISRLTGKAPNVTYDSARMATHAMYYSAEKAVKYLGMPQTPIETALRDAVDWFRANGYAD